MSNKLTEYLESLPKEQRDSLPSYEIIQTANGVYRARLYTKLSASGHSLEPEILRWCEPTKVGPVYYDSSNDIDIIRNLVINRYKQILESRFPNVVERGP